MRKKREKILNGCYEVSSNFHPGIQKYISGNVKKKLLRLIQAARKIFRFKIKNLCIVDTHFHLIIKPGEGEDLSKIVGWFKQKFTQWLNRQFGLSGSAWTERFFSKVIDSLSCLLYFFQYIANTPIKVGLTFSIDEYPFYEVWDNDLSQL